MLINAAGIIACEATNRGGDRDEEIDLRPLSLLKGIILASFPFICCRGVGVLEEHLLDFAPCVVHGRLLS